MPRNKAGSHKALGQPSAICPAPIKPMVWVSMMLLKPTALTGHEQKYHRFGRQVGSFKARYDGRMSADDAETRKPIRDNLAEVRQRIAVAAARSGRPADRIRLIGVTKYVSPEIARTLAEAGLLDLAESRPQELWRKAESLPDLSISWHMIGHLQRNKVKRTLPLAAYIHSADSVRLLQEISVEAAAQGAIANVLLEVNVSGDAAKTGLPPEAIEPLIPAIGNLPGIRVLGLMTMAGLEGGLDRARRILSPSAN